MALLSVYPKYHWLPWNFSKSPVSIFDGKHDKQFVAYLSKHLEISKLDDWYRVSRADLSRIKAEAYLKKRGGLIKMVKREYPNHQWEPEKFNQRQKRSCQWWLYKIIKQIFPPNIEVIEEYSHPWMKFATGCPMMLDIYVTSFKLVFEYHGYQHYNSHFLFGDAKSCKERADERHTACESMGITLIEVPYWWQRDTESVVASLRKFRPDIVLDAPGFAPISY